MGYDDSEVIRMKQIGKNIKKHRASLGMTQDQLAEKLNVTRQAVSSWETGKTQPSIETLTALAALFGISVETLIYGKTMKVDIVPDNGVGTGVIFGALFLIFMTFFLLGGVALFTNGWGLIIAVSLTLAGLITALFKLSEQIDALTARIERLENK